MLYWIVFLGIIVLHLIYRAFWNYSKVRQINYFQKLRKDDFERFTEETAVIKEILLQAGLEDNKMTIDGTRGKRISGPRIDQFIPDRIQVSIFQNLASGNKQLDHHIELYLKQAKGVFRSKMRQSLNITYVVDLLIGLPQKIFQHYGVSGKNVLVNLVQVIYWIVSLVKILSDFGLLDLKSVL